MLEGLLVETFTRTDAAGTRRGARVRWDPPGALDTEIIVRWHYRADPAPWGDWYQSDRLTGASFELFPAAPGRYEFEVFDQQPGRSVGENGFFELPVPALLESELALPKPSGVELLGPSGELLGSARTVTGRDLRIRWNAVRLDALQTEGAGEAPGDELLELLEVRIVGPSGAVLRTVPLPVNTTEWTYSYAMNTEDQPLDPADFDTIARAVRIELRWQDKLGRFSDPAVLQIAHTLQLSATADLELLATVALTEVIDDTDLSPAFPIDTYVQLDEVEIEGLGYPVQVQFTDKCFWEVSPVPIEYVFLRYRLRILDEADVVVASAEQEVIEDWGWGQLFGDIYQQPNLTVRAALELGETYRAQVHFYWNRPDAGTKTLGADSRYRRFLITDLKR